MVVCVTDQDTLTNPNLCGLCKNLTPDFELVFSAPPAKDFRLWRSGSRFTLVRGSIAQNRVFDKDYYYRSMGGLRTLRRECASYKNGLYAT